MTVNKLIAVLEFVAFVIAAILVFLKENQGALYSGAVGAALHGANHGGVG